MKETPMDLLPATNEQIESFLKGAADFYAEKGIDPDTAATKLFAQLNKVAQELQLKPAKPSPEKIAKQIIATCTKMKLKIKKKKAKK